MDEIKTFVIGAGASAELKFPTSFELVDDIISCLESVITRISNDEIYSHSQSQFTNFVSVKSNISEVITVINCIKYLSCNLNINGQRVSTLNYQELEKYKKVAISLKGKLEPRAITIDNLLSRFDTSDDEKLISKIVIASIIKSYEKQTALFSKPQENIRFDDKLLLSNYLFKILKLFCHRPIPPEDVLKNKNFIVLIMIVVLSKHFLNILKIYIV